MTTIEYDLKEILTRLENKVDKIGEDISGLTIKASVLAEKVDGITKTTRYSKVYQSWSNYWFNCGYFGKIYQGFRTNELKMLKATLKSK